MRRILWVYVIASLFFSATLINAQDAAAAPDVTVSDQVILDNTVTVASAFSDGPAFIVIHTDNNGSPGPVIGMEAINPGWNYNADTGLFRLEDGNLVLETTKKVSMGTQLDYPNYKSRSAMQYELLIGDKKARFATTDRFRYPLYVFCAQNDYLSATGAEAWIAYDGILYRLEALGEREQTQQ